MREHLSKEEKQTRAGIYFYAWKTYKHIHPMTRLAMICKTTASNFSQCIIRRKESK